MDPWEFVSCKNKLQHLQEVSNWGTVQTFLGAGNSNISIFHRDPWGGEDEPILTNIFFNWVVQPPTRYLLMGVWHFDDCIFLGGFV